MFLCDASDTKNIKKEPLTSVPYVQCVCECVRCLFIFPFGSVIAPTLCMLDQPPVSLFLLAVTIPACHGQKHHINTEIELRGNVILLIKSHIRFIHCIITGPSDLV